MLAKHDLYYWTHASSPLNFTLFFWYGLIEISNRLSQNSDFRDALVVILGVNCFHSIELNTTVSKRRSHWTSHTLFHCICCHHINDRFWFEETSTGSRSKCTQWVWEIWEYEKVWEKAKKLNKKMQQILNANIKLPTLSHSDSPEQIHSTAYT